MEKYKNTGGDSGIAGYESGTDFIRVQFLDGSVYLYTNAVTGTQQVTQMKALAAQGSGLNSYINIHVRKAYAAREK